jgi:uncharacterized membrane protein HdeD (DUF308 family)
MGENWNKKKSVEDVKTQWSVIVALLALILLPLIGVLAIFYFMANNASLLMLFTLGGLCLLSMALPLIALFFLRKSSKNNEW